MLNLILKDIYNSKKIIILYALVGIGLILSMNMSSPNTGSVGAFVFIMAYGVVIRNEYLEDKNNAYTLYRTLPIRPYKVVVSKYITGILVIMLAMVLSVSVQCFASRFFLTGLPVSPQQFYLPAVSAGCSALMFVGGFYVMAFKYGTVKAINYARLILFALFCGLMFLITILKRMAVDMNLSGIASIIENIRGIWIVLIVMAVYIMFMVISIRLYGQKNEI